MNTLFRKPLRKAVAAFTLSLACIGAAGAQETSGSDAGALTDEQWQQRLEEGLIKLLEEKPELVRQALERDEKRKEAQKRERASRMLAERRDQVESVPDAFVAGNPEGDVTIVEFFDYNCPYCERAFSSIMAVIESDPNVRFILREFPILSTDSQDAARVAVAVAQIQPDLYFTFHQALYAYEGKVNLAISKEVAIALGVDKDRLDEELADANIPALIQENYTLAGLLDVSGTPAFTIGEELFRGYLTAQQIKGIVNDMRACGKTKCADQTTSISQ